MNVAHQSDTVYLTFYVYSADGKPTWFVALATYSGQTAAGALLYTGDLYVTTGPYFGAPFVPSSVTTRRAGTATFRADSVNTATLTYSVDGVPVTKFVQRYVLKTMDLTGNYLGKVVETDYGCTNPALNGKSALAGSLNVQQSNGQVTVAAAVTDGIRNFTCTYRGTFTQAGRMAGISNGTFSCTTGASGTFTAYEIEVSPKGMTGRFDAAYPALGCSAYGTFGGLTK